MKGVSIFLIILLALVLVGASGDNLIGIHDPNSSLYNDNCLDQGCHATLLQEEKSLDPRIPSIHNKMIPYVPGYNPRKGVTNETCKHCHRNVDMLYGSGANIRKQVSPQNCAVCHSPAGPGKPLYQ